MKRFSVLALILIGLQVLCAPAGRADGLNLAWGDCAGSSRATSDVSFSCDNETSTFLIVASFIPPDGVDQMSGEEGLMTLVTDKSFMPDWWQLGDNGCRNSSVGFGATMAGGSCPSPWVDMSAGGQHWLYPSGSRSQLQFLWARAPAAIKPISSSREYVSYVISITSDGVSRCSGCQEPICVVFDQLLLTQPPGVGDQMITRASSRNFVSWQGGGSACAAAGGREAQRKSWGQIKNIYR